MLSALPSRKFRRPRKAVRTSPLRRIRVYTSSCLLAERSVELSEASAKKLELSMASLSTDRIGAAIACVIVATE